MITQETNEHLANANGNKTISTIPPIPAVQSINATNLFVKIQSFSNDPNNKNLPYFVTKVNQSLIVSSSVKPKDQLFQLTKDNRILTQIGNKVLDLDSKNNVILNLWDESSKTQIWSYDSTNFTIKNTGNNLYLNFDSSFNLVVNSKSSQFYFGPTYPLLSIMKDKPVSFPVYENEQAQAFVYISQQVSGTQNIRTQYTNPTLVPGYLNAVTNLPYPANQSFSESDFSTVKTQLMSELTKACAINSLITNYTNFHTQLFSQTEAILGKLETAAGLDSGSTSEFALGWVITLFTGLVCTIIDIIPEVGPPVANLIQTSVDTTFQLVDAISNYKTDFNPAPFDVTLYELKSVLISNFNGVLNALTAIGKAILEDWGKMSKTYSAMQLPPGQNSLAWTIQTPTQITGPAITANTVSLLQMLLPSKYTIFVATTKDNKPSDAPSYCYFKSGNLIYFIAQSDTPTIYPSSNLMSNEVWANYVTQLDFYTGNYGWNFPVAIYGEDDFVTPTFSNNTNVPMSVEIQYQGKTLGGEIHTYSSYTYIADGDGYPELDQNFTCTIKDKKKNTIVSFKITYNDGDVTLKGLSYSEGYSNFVINGPNIKKGGSGFSASINVPISYVENQIKLN